MYTFYVGEQNFNLIFVRLLFGVGCLAFLVASLLYAFLPV